MAHILKNSQQLAPTAASAKDSFNSLANIGCKVMQEFMQSPGVQEHQRFFKQNSGKDDCNAILASRFQKELFDLCYRSHSSLLGDSRSVSFEQVKAIVKALDNLAVQKDLIVQPHRTINEQSQQGKTSWIRRRKKEIKEFFHPNQILAAERLRVANRFATHYDVVPEAQHPYKQPPVLGQFTVKVAPQALPALLDQLPDLLRPYTSSVGKVRVNPAIQTVTFVFTGRDKQQIMSNQLSRSLNSRLPGTIWLPTLPGQMKIGKPNAAVGTYAELQLAPGEKKETISRKQSRQLVRTIQKCIIKYGGDQLKMMKNFNHELDGTLLEEEYDVNSGGCSVLAEDRYLRRNKDVW